MKVKDLLLQFSDIDALYKRYLALYPLFAWYEREALTPNQLKSGEERHRVLFDKFMERIKSTEISDSENVLFVIEQINEFSEPDEPDKAFESWMCKRDDIFKKAESGDVSLWIGKDDENHLEHYGYDMSPLADVLSMEVYPYEVDLIDAACEIIENLTFFGIEEEKRMDKVEDIIESLTTQCEEIEAGTAKTIPAEEVFAQLEQEIWDEATEEERIEIKKQREEKEKNKRRDNVLLHLVMNMNHMKHKMAILSYYRQQILDKKVILENK